jgi:dipeptidyl aminopeptidase/acylaminoacyl peptidase
MECRLREIGVPRSAPRAARASARCSALALAAASVAAFAQPPPSDTAAIERLFATTVEPSAAVDPQGRYLLVVHEHKLLDLDQLAAPVIGVAGRDINPATHGPHAPLDYFALTLIDLGTGMSAAIPLPRGSTIGFPAWAPDGSKFAFTLTTSVGTELWLAEPSDTRARKLVGDLNATLGPPCTWMPDSERVLCRRIAWPGDSAPQQSAAGGRPAPGQPWIVDARLARGLLESNLELISVRSDLPGPIGSPAAFESVEPAPSSAFLLVTRVREPYPLVSGVDEVERVTEVWDGTGRVVARLPDDARAAHWHPSRPATLVWTEHAGGADRVVMENEPFFSPPREIHRTTGRFSGIDWLADSDVALVQEYSAPERMTRVWLVDAQAASSPSRLLYEGGVDDALAELGSPFVRMNRAGKRVVATHDDGFYVRGEETTEDGARAYLAHVRLRNGSAKRIWESTKSGYEQIVDLLMPSADLLLTRHESTTEPPNYFVSTREQYVLRATDHQHPAPELLSGNRLRLVYPRADGYMLSADLYLPPGASEASRAPLVVWAYPRQVAADGPTVARNARERFFDAERVFKHLFLLHGYAVLDNVSMPIVGAGREANDTFIEQIVANAEAAIAAAADTGFVDPTRVGVAGHSYGAFMTGNLLAHSELFNAGIALSGAYNRTLTPFGFQTERRTFWEAPDTYLAMSPLLYSNQITAPLLLVHGLEDKNPGTSPLQSTQFYQAIRGNGGEAELLLLPLEGHSYRARESMLRTATAMLSWFDRHL